MSQLDLAPALGVWEAESVSAILELAASSPSLRTKSSPRAELGSLRLLLGVTIVGWHPKLGQAPSLACPLWGRAQRGQLPSGTIALQTCCQGTLVFWDERGNVRSPRRGSSLHMDP